MQLLNLIMQMQVALAQRLRAIWLVIENLSRSVLSQIALETRDYLNKIILTNFVWNEWSARALS